MIHPGNSIFHILRGLEVIKYQGINVSVQYQMCITIPWGTPNVHNKFGNENTFVFAAQKINKNY